MSGGHFEYKQYEIQNIIDSIEQLIVNNNASNEWCIYNDTTIAKFEEAIHVLKKASVMAQRIDWLASGDDSEESFHTRWDEELKNNIM